MATPFDPDKDAANIAKHGVSLSLAFDMDFDVAIVREDTHAAYGEQRFQAIGPIEGALYVLAFTYRNEEIRPTASAAPKRPRPAGSAKSLSNPMAKRDDENPILDDAFFAEARLAREVLSADAIAAFKAKGGRPKAEQVKKPVSIRLDPDLLVALKATGPGWQSRVNGLLRDAVLSEKRGKNKGLKTLSTKGRSPAAGQTIKVNATRGGTAKARGAK